MKSTAKIIIVLTVITIISGAILAVLDSFTAPKIEAYQNNLKNEAVAEVLPKGVEIETLEMGEKVIYKATKKGKEAGYAFQVSGGGYQSELVIMVAVTPDFKEIIATKMIAQVETPGLGTKIENDPSNKDNAGWFMTQFAGVALSPDITYVKNAKPSKANEIEAITGATISSAAVVRILNNGIKEAKALLNK